MIGLEEAVVTGGRRLERAWPARKWTAELRSEYGDALRSVGDPRAIVDGCLRAVREWGGDFPPSIASLLELVWDAQRARLVVEAQEERNRNRTAKIELAPAWWARLVMASVVHSAAKRGQALPRMPRQLPYIEIAERHDVVPDDLDLDALRERRGIPAERGALTWLVEHEKGKAADAARAARDLAAGTADAVPGSEIARELLGSSLVGANGAS